MIIERPRQGFRTTAQAPSWVLTAVTRSDPNLKKYPRLQGKPPCGHLGNMPHHPRC